jgi:hypothetical protein
MSRIAMPVGIVLTLLISTVASVADAQTAPRAFHTAPRHAQPMARGYILGGVSFLFGDGDFTDHRTIKTNAEDGSFDANYTNPNSTGFEVAGGVRLWKYLGARIGVAHYSSGGAADVALSVPHPFFFQRPRTLSATADGVRHDETWIHAHALATFVANKHFQMSVFGGPSFVNMTQGEITDVTYTDVFPYDVITNGQVRTADSSASEVTFGGGADVLYYFTKVVGVAGTVEFASAKTTLATANGGSVTVTSGGPRAGVGLSIRFR